MSLQFLKMTRRKQNAPKRLKSTDKAGSSLTNQQTVSPSQVTSDSAAGEADEEEEEDEGDTNSDEEKSSDRQADKPIHDPETANSPYISSRQDSQAFIHQGSDRSGNKTPHQLEDNGAQKYSAVTKAGKCDSGTHIRKSASSSGQEINVSSSSGKGETTFPWNSSSTGSSSNLGNHKYKYSSKLSPPLVASSSSVSLTTLDPQMAMVMSSIPLGLLSRVKNSSSPHEASMNYNSLPATGQHEDQPLDLSRKPNKPTSDKATVSTSFASLSTPASNTSTTNGFSSLQSLQQRFGGDYPLGLSHKSSSAIIPLQPSMIHKSAVTSHSLCMTNDTNMRPGISKSKSDLRLDNLDKQDTTRASDVSPMHKGAGSRHTSPMLPEEPVAEMAGKHTIHRCSCQKSFSTLYALSLHLQETGHTPGSSKSASLMDYPKLVRGQDMWLNQESEQTRRILRCMQCGESFKSLPLLTVHMMQTQHYTKIVTSDHGRRSHKCSTYCDRELDKECIFKCKVCHDAFTDMEGLANHMIVSGHHKKQSSRHNSSTADLSSDPSSLVRQGRRKRFLPDDIASAASSGTSSSTVASLLEYRQTQAMTAMNGFHPQTKPTSVRTPEAQSLFQCDSCGKSVVSGDFDSHVRACLRHRAEVIDALKNKLAVEEALLSRSESKLLRSGFKLSSLSGQRENMLAIAGFRGKESIPSDDRENNCEKDLDESHLGCYSQIKSERENTSPGHKHNSSTAEPKTLPKTGEISAKICDVAEVPLKTWHCSSGESQQLLVKEEDANSGGQIDLSLNVKLCQVPKTDVNCINIQITKREAIAQDVPQEGKSTTLSPGVGEKRKLSEIDAEKDDSVRKRDRLGTELVQEFTEKPADFTSSALHKLDMFSRGLTFSPPKRNISPEFKSHSHHSSRASKKRDSTSSLTKSPQAVPASPLSQIKSDSPGPPKKDITFDIIDPNADSGHIESSSSALEAMESFIHKSFSVKSDLRSSNLASMFSPFRNCFPLPGTLPGQSSMVPESSDRALSHFAKFSKFFRMVPGIPQFPESAHSVDSKKLEEVQSHLPSPSLSETRPVISQDRPVFLGRKGTSKPNNTSPTIKVPVVKVTSEASPGNTHAQRISGGQLLDSSSASKKYKFSTGNAVASLNSPVRSQNHSQHLPQTSDKRDARTEDSGQVKMDEMLILHPDLEKSLDESKKKRKSEDILDREDGKSKMRNIKVEDEFRDEVDEKHVNDETEGKMNEDSSSLQEETHKCNDEDGVSGSFLYDDKFKLDTVSESATIHMPEDLSSKIEDQLDDGKKHEKANESIKHGKTNAQDIPAKKNHIYEELETRNEDDMQEDLPAKDGEGDSLNHLTDKRIKEEAGYNNESWNASKPSISVRCKQEADLQRRGEDTDGDSPVFRNQLNFFRTKSPSENVNRESDESNCNNCDGDIDTDDDDDNNCGGDDGDEDTVRSGSVILKRNKERRKIRTWEIDSKRGIGTATEQIHTKSVPDIRSEVVTVKVEEDNVCEDKNDEEPTSSEEHVQKANNLKAMKSLRKQSQHRDNVSSEEEEQESSPSSEKLTKQDEQNKYGSEFHFARKCSTALKPSGKENASALDADHEVQALKGSGADILNKPAKFTEEGPVFSQLASKNTEEVDKQEKKSALDSLSSFVYSQPLTSEHPLDSLHRLLSTNDLTHLTADPHKYLPVTPNKCLTVDISAPLNLTSKGGVNASSGGGSSDENDESDLAAAEGGTSEGDLRDYKCAACNRKFASKGSYRYHLSRCHLSSVKKYGIKEAFNMSPYVYLPLDHTAKFSKYYQLAHELANKGK